ncbi:LPXTG-motif cell wall-anchored protein [Microbacteriaceae bacterium SG_E_30_P1]|uniref:LPXTG-motif cell wall-anchored protein n=1 Tax=Antiquaquibacter oligotrophicus TaxID=2880260 RepID=A0ABT6KJJ5_9MICO|nr:sugar phosphate isomerase/epimerase [Antiquaquibacter oligotrophicus]MDH6180095.1 LPXTG-motif cell wall-anchored protein [Antiquaquibacter oligotrophicus]UDF14154.1 sugar phosphate isomerase/epimerase [Antiquaquibacter oligotrophicus]
MIRRGLTAGLVAGAAAALLLPQAAVAAEDDRVLIPADQVSIQMFSLIPWTSADGLEPVLERLSEIGLKNIEPFGGTFSGYTATEFRALTDSLGLSVPSSHYNTAEDTFDATLEFVDTLGQEYVGSGGFAAPGIGSYENTLATAEAMNRLGERSVAAGVGKFFGHNHASEFTTMYEHDGVMMPAWEILVAETNPEWVTFQLDVGWATHAGVNVADLIGEYSDRISLLHIKDAVNLGGAGNPTFVNLGEGDVPLQDILAAGQAAGIDYYVMEYDLAADGNSFATEGFEYLTGIPAGPWTEVTPAAVTFSGSKFTVPTTEGIEYVKDGAVIAAGTYDGSGTVTVTARAIPGWVIAEGAVTEWTHTFPAPALAATGSETAPGIALGAALVLLAGAAIVVARRRATAS